MQDPIILLSGTQTGTPTMDSGIMINRGSGATQGFIWDESADEFSFIQTNDPSTVIGNVNITAYSNIRANGATLSQIKLTAGATAGYILSSDSTGLGSWTNPATILSNISGVTGSGTTNYVPYWKSINNLSSTSSLYISGDNVNIGTTGSYARFAILGANDTVYATGSAYGLTDNTNNGVVATIYNLSQTVGSYAGLKLITRSAGAKKWAIYNVSKGSESADLTFGHGNGDIYGTEVMRLTDGGDVIIGATGVTQQGTSINDKFNVEGRSYLTKGIHSFQGLNTSTNTQGLWYKVCQFGDIANDFDFATFQMRVDVGGPATGQQISADVYINYKQQLTSHYAYINIVNYGSLPLLKQDFEILRNNATSIVTIYIRHNLQYQIPDYTYIGSVPKTILNLGAAVSLSLSAEPNDTWTQKVITNGITSDPITGNLGASGSVTANNYFLSQTQYGRVAERHTKTVYGLTSSQFTDLFRVIGRSSGGYSAMVRAVFDGTTGNVVMSMVADIVVNHYNDITISSVSGNYVQLVLRVLHDRNRTFIVQGKVGNPVSMDTTTMPVVVNVYPLGGEEVLFDNFRNTTLGSIPEPWWPDVPGQSYTGLSSSHIHYGLLGGTRISGGDELGTPDLAGSLSVMGRLGVGTSSSNEQNRPLAKLHVNNTTSAVSFLVEDDSDVDSTPFAISNTGNVSIGTASTTVKLDLYGSMNIVSGLTNNSIRPAVSAATLANGEIRSYSTQGVLYDDGFLRLSAGGGTTTNSKAFIDITGYSNVYDMNNNIVLGTRNLERMRVDLNGNVGIGLSGPNARLNVKADPAITGSTVFKVDGNAGELFTVTDSLTGSLMSVNDISGLPILEVFDDNTILMGDYQSPSLNTTTKSVLNSSASYQNIFQISKTIYSAIFFEYVVSNSSNMRAGTLMAVWDGTNIEFTDNSTSDLGSTAPFVLRAVISGTNVIIQALVSTSSWTIKAMIRSV